MNGEDIIACTVLMQELNVFPKVISCCVKFFSKKKPALLNVVNFIFTAVTTLRLQGPFSANGTGRVEVFYNGQWGTVCDRDWDIFDAKVVCRQLGYTNAAKALDGRDVPDGTGQVWLDDVNCDGTERSLTSCCHSGWGATYCRHYRDAGVECISTGKFIHGQSCIYMLLPFLYPLFHLFHYCLTRTSNCTGKKHVYCKKRF